MRSIRYTSEDFDHFVGVLISRWEDAIERQGRWRLLDGEEHALYTEDWPVNNDIHRHLAEYAAEHELTEDQKTQWNRLNKLVAEHKKDLEEMGYRVLVPASVLGREAA